MKKIIISLLLAAWMVFGLTACASGSLFVQASNNRMDGGSKTGEACITNILGIISTGDASVGAAAKAGGITEVYTVDVVGEGGFFSGKICTIVTGR